MCMEGDHKTAGGGELPKANDLLVQRTSRAPLRASGPDVAVAVADVSQPLERRK